MSVGALLKTLRRARQRSQLDIAVSAGLTQKHVSFIETGRVRPGRTTLERLAQALQLSQPDREILLAAGGYLPSTPTSPSGPESVHALTAAMTQRLLAQQEPYPAILVDRAQNLIAMNQGFARLIAHWADGDALWQRTCGDGRPNLLRASLHPKGLFPFMAEPEQLVPNYLNRVIAQGFDDPDLCRLLDDICEWPNIAPLFTGRRSTDVPIQTEERYCLDRTELRFDCLSAAIGAPSAWQRSTLFLELFYPADDTTEDVLRCA